MNFEDAGGEDSKGSEEPWRKGDPCYIVVEILATLMSSVMWKAENMPHELDDLVKKISKQSVKITAYL